jgi:hypothetical protein
MTKVEQTEYEIDKIISPEMRRSSTSMEHDKEEDFLETLIKPEAEHEIEIEHEDEEPAPSEEDDLYNRKINRIKKKISLESKMERKINVDHNEVERQISNFLLKYDIDDKINTYTLQLIDEFQNINTATHIIDNIEKHSEEMLFDVDLFIKIDSFTKTLIRDALEKERLTDEYTSNEIYREIISAIDTHIELTLSSVGIDKLTLVSYHFFIRNLEDRAREFINEYQKVLPSINKQKTATSLYHKEVMNILSNHVQLKAFTATIISITSSWLEKYRQKSAKLGQFISDLTLSTNDVMIDKISRYILLIALKNKNPLVLRSVFSTFLSLIHRNIASLMSVSLVNVKVGYFRSMSHMFEDNENAKIHQDRHQMLSGTLLKVLKHKNRKNFKDNHQLQKVFQSVIDPNFIDFFNYASGEYNPLDEFYTYIMYGRYIKNSDNQKAESIKLKNEVKPGRNTTVIKKYLDLKSKQYFLSTIYDLYEDEEATTYVVNRLKTNISKELDPNCYVTYDGDIVDRDVNTMYDEIDTIIKKSSYFLSSNNEKEDEWALI